MARRTRNPVSAATNKTVDQDVKTFKSLAKALKDAGTMSANMPRDYNGTYARQQEQSVIYGKAVAMILELEDKLAEAEKSKDKDKKGSKSESK